MGMSCIIIQGDGKQGTFNLWSDNYPTVPYIPPGMVEGKEIMQDEWEVSCKHPCYSMITLLQDEEFNYY